MTESSVCPVMGLERPRGVAELAPATSTTNTHAPSLLPRGGLQVDLIAKLVCCQQGVAASGDETVERVVVWWAF